jgi:ribonucleoside-diphosphate reductase alpha chain
MTRNPEIPMAKSLVDYIFRWLAMEFVPGFRAAFAPKREKKVAPPAAEKETRGTTDAATRGQGSADSSSAMSTSLPPTDGLSAPVLPPAPKKEGNGHGPRISPDTARGFNYDGSAETGNESHHASSPPAAPGLRLALIADPLSQQGSEMQADAPACDVCGSITVRSGTCYKCMNCGNSMGCS